MTKRSYLDWNATAPLRPEACDAMLAAMDVTGNPSSVHAEGRKARAIVERARAQVADAFGAMSSDIVFTSGATESAALGLAELGVVGSAIEHDCVAAWIEPALMADAKGQVAVKQPAETALQAANSETGVLQELPQHLAFIDAVQVAGKLPFAFEWTGARAACLSAHKFGGPKGVGALLLKSGTDLNARILGGGQEQGRRAGTENVIGIAGFGAACAAAQRDVSDGLWTRVSEIRNTMEIALEEIAPDIIFFGRDAPRLPNTSCFAVRSWKSETQVMQMDLAGFAVSAGSACSSGKVRTSKVLTAMGHDAQLAASAIRVSLGPDTTREEVLAFVGAWEKHYRRFRQKAA